MQGKLCLRSAVLVYYTGVLLREVALGLRSCAPILILYCNPGFRILNSGGHWTANPRSKVQAYVYAHTPGSKI